MLVMFNETENLIGLWEDGWNVVLVARLVYAQAPGNRRHCGMASELHEYNSNWVAIGSL